MAGMAAPDESFALAGIVYSAASVHPVSASKRISRRTYVI